MSVEVLQPGTCISGGVQLSFVGGAAAASFPSTAPDYLKTDPLRLAQEQRASGTDGSSLWAAKPPTIQYGVPSVFLPWNASVHLAASRVEQLLTDGERSRVLRQTRSRGLPFHPLRL